MMDALAAGVAVLERSIAYALGSLALVTPPLLIRPTPCPRWDLLDLMHHFNDSMAALREAAECGSVALAPFGAGSSGEIIAETRAQAVDLLGAWTNGPCAPTVRVETAPLSAPLAAAVGAIEVTVHGWDVAEACGTPRPIPDPLADELLDLAVILIRPPDRPGRFGRPLPIDPDAPAGHRLLAFLGRAPR